MSGEPEDAIVEWAAQQRAARIKHEGELASLRASNAKKVSCIKIASRTSRDGVSC